jgi:phosphatidylinositol alpha-mannosyltransferase
VYASPSTYEGFGLPYLEAMACGAPVLASPNPGSREVLDDGRCGVLADDGAFARELAALLRDAPRRAALAAEGLRRAREYSLSRMVGDYEELLYELTEVHAGTTARV